MNIFFINTKMHFIIISYIVWFMFAFLFIVNLWTLTFPEIPRILVFLATNKIEQLTSPPSFVRNYDFKMERLDNDVWEMA